MLPSAGEHERRERAADWVVRLSADDVSEAEALAFDAWIASPPNAAAYDSALAVWGEFGANAGPVLQGLRERRARPKARSRFYLAGGAVAAALAALAVVVPRLAPPVHADRYVTQAGERRSVLLPDGTRIELNAGTRITVALGGRERDVTLPEGEAAFDVAHDPRRPFVISAGDRTIRVVGTRFDVRRRAGRLSVTVDRGAVEVVPAEAGAGGGYRLYPGQRLDHTEGALESRVAAVDASDAFAWRAGRLVYRGESLGQVAADLNAQFKHPIRIPDPGLAAEPVSGVLILDDEAAVVRRLALLVSAHAVPSDGGVILQRNETPKR